MQPPENERDLVQLAQTGDKTAVSALYQAYAQAVFQYVSYRVESAEVAEDLTADVFLRMVRSLPEYAYTGAPFGAWLFRIAANRLTDYYRERQRTPMTPISDDFRSDAIEITRQLEIDEEHRQLRQALARLPDDYQNILILRFIREQSHAEVAAVTGKSEAAVRVMQHRALKALAAELAKDEQGGAGRNTGGSRHV